MASVVRVVDLETTGSQPWAHGVCEIGWQDVALGPDGWQVTDGRGAILTHPGRAIPPVTAAIHHIVDSDVADAPLFRAVAPAILAAAPVVALAAHRAAFEARWCTADLTGGRPWICTWKCALRVWPDAPSFSNQVLRYWRMPAGLDRDLGLPVHRAGPDAYVTAHHLRDLLTAASLDALIAWSAVPALLPRVPFGPNRGKAWSDLDDAALAAAASDRDEDVRHSAAHETARRRGLPPPALPVAAAQGQLL